MQDRAALAKQRYSIIPHMQEYDALRQYVMPYVSQSNPPGHHGNAVETDHLGFRVSYWRNQKLDSKSWFAIKGVKKTLLTGGSVGFGWGATSDLATPASLLSQEINSPVQSLGIMAGTSIQESIAALPFYHAADHIVSITSLNTLLCCLAATPNFFDLYGPCYPFNNRFWEDVWRYDVLMLRYLVSDDINPKSFFKQKSQSRLFRQNLYDRFKRRVMNRLKPQQTSLTRRSLEEGLQYAVDITCRDIHNMHNAAGKKPYICALQPHAPSMKRELSLEEKQLAEIAKNLMAADMYDYTYVTFPKIWPRYIAEIRRYCEAHEIKYLDLNEANYDGWCFMDSCHFTDRGNLITAKAIAGAMTKL